jgi:hypothetical protein
MKIQSRVGAGDGNRTHVCSLGSCRSTIELRPRAQSFLRVLALSRRSRNGPKREQTELLGKVVPEQSRSLRGHRKWLKPQHAVP